MKQGRAKSAAYLRGALLLLAAALLLFVAAGVRARSTSEYDLSWWSVDGGGETFEGGMHSASGAITLSGTAGQPDAGLHEGGAYLLAGGFEPGGEVFFQQRYLYLSLVSHGY